MPPFYPVNQFGVWPIDHPHVEYRCTMVLTRVRCVVDLNIDKDRVLALLLMWDADRCLCDDPEFLIHDSVKYSFAHHWHTQAALDQWIATGKTNGIIFEHAVPRKVVFDGLVRLARGGQLRTWNDVLAYLQPLRAIALVTRAEDQELNAAGLKQCMPEDWAGDAFARYEHPKVGITLLPPNPQDPPPVARRRTTRIQRDGQPLARREKIALLAQVLDRRGADSPYLQVGSADDRLAAGRGTDRLCDSVLSREWLNVDRNLVRNNHATDAWATGLPVAAWFEVYDNVLELKVGVGEHHTAGRSAGIRAKLKDSGYDDRGAPLVLQIPLDEDAGEALSTGLDLLKPHLEGITAAMIAAGAYPVVPA